MLFVASNASDWWMTTFTPSSSDQMIRNLSMKIGEVDSGSARLLAAHSNLAEPESTSPIFMLKFLREVSSNSNANTNVDYRYPLSLPKIFKDVLCNHFDRPLTIFILYQPH